METGSARVAGTPPSASDIELFNLIENSLYTAVVCDSLDQLGYRDQAMREWMRPLHPEYRFAGRARTIAYVDVYHIGANPYEGEIAAVDSILSGEVVVASTAG